MFPEYGGPGPGASLASAFSNAFQKSTGLAQERRRQTQAEELQRAMLAMQGVQYDPEGFKAPASPVAPIVNPLEAGQDQLDQRFEGAQQMGPPSAGNLATGVPYGRKPGAFDPQMGRFTPPTPEVQPPAAQGPPPHEYEPLTPHYRLDRTMLQQRREQALADKLKEHFGEKAIDARFQPPRNRDPNDPALLKQKSDERTHEMYLRVAAEAKAAKERGERPPSREEFIGRHIIELTTDRAGAFGMNTPAVFSNPQDAVKQLGAIYDANYGVPKVAPPPIGTGGAGGVVDPLVKATVDAVKAGHVQASEIDASKKLTPAQKAQAKVLLAPPHSGDRY